MNLQKYHNMKLSITDAHVHYFNTGIMDYPWLEQVPAINRNFETQEYKDATKDIMVDKIVFVQCECLPEQYRAEINYVGNLSKFDSRIQGIVAYFPLEKANAENDLKRLIQENRLIKGIRRLEEKLSLYKDDKFIQNLGLLQQYGLSFDICVKSNQIDSAVHLVSKQPEISYMLNHLGKPDIKNYEYKDWSKAIKKLAANPNVYCKISGMFNEADWKNWKTEDLKPYYDLVKEEFGVDRLVFGGDWPVVTLVDSYSRWMEAFLDLTKDLSHETLKKIVADNANHFYKLNSNHA